MLYIYLSHFLNDLANHLQIRSRFPVSGLLNDVLDKQNKLYLLDKQNNLYSHKLSYTNTGTYRIQDIYQTYKEIILYID